MTVGSHVFGDGRVGCWVMPSPSLADKLRHRLPQLKRFGVTDIFLPPDATPAEKTIVLDARYYAAMYAPPPAGRSATEYAEQALTDLASLRVNVLELNIEGVADLLMSDYVRACVRVIRAKRPSLRLRINVVPWKGKYLPVDLFAADPQLYLIVQAYLGNMDERLAEDELVRELVDYGVSRHKVSVMYGAHCRSHGLARVPSLPKIRFRGSIYQDDLLADAGYIS